MARLDLLTAHELATRKFLEIKTRRFRFIERIDVQHRVRIRPVNCSRRRKKALTASRTGLPRNYGLRKVVTELVKGPRAMKDQELSTRIILTGGLTERLVMVVRLVT